MPPIKKSRVQNPPQPAFSSSDDESQELNKRQNGPVETETSDSEGASDSGSESTDDAADSDQGEVAALRNHAAAMRNVARNMRKFAKDARSVFGRGASSEKTNQGPNEPLHKRASKHAPMEEPVSRRPVSALRDAVQKKGFKGRDPRFAPDSKVHDDREADLAHRRYSFLFDDAMPNEVKQLKASMKKAKTELEKNGFLVQLSRLQQSLKEHDDRKLMHEVEQEWKESERKKLEAGKNPYYLKASEMKKRMLEKKFARLEACGELEKYMAKKRKRQAAKMHKKLPQRRDEFA